MDKKNLPSRAYLLNLKPKVRMLTASLSIDVHRVDSNVRASTQGKKFNQFMTCSGLLIASVCG